MHSFRYLGALLLSSLAAGSAIPLKSRNENLLTKRDGLCDGSGPFIINEAVGSGINGDAFCETGWNTRPYFVNTITIFSVPEAVTGIQLGYSDGYQSQVYGDPNQSAQSITIDYVNGEVINYATVLGAINGNGKVVRGLLITTNKGQTVAGGQQPGDGSGVPDHEQLVGAGILMGISGRAGPSYLTQASLYFLESPVSSIVLSNLQFPNGPTGAAGISPDTLENVHFYNNGQPGSDTWTFTGNRQFMTSRMISSSTQQTNTVASTFTVTSSFPFVINASGGQTFTWAYAQTSMSGTTMSQTDNVQWSQSGTLGPNQGLDCSAVIGSGGGTFPYIGTISITLDDGYQYSYTESGSIQLTSVSSASVACTQDNSA